MTSKAWGFEVGLDQTQAGLNGAKICQTHQHPRIIIILDNDNDNESDNNNENSNNKEDNDKRRDLIAQIFAKPTNIPRVIIIIKSLSSSSPLSTLVIMANEETWVTLRNHMQSARLLALQRCNSIIISITTGHNINDIIIITNEHMVYYEAGVVRETPGSEAN